MKNTPFSDFMRNAPEDERREVFLEAARLATEDQNRMLNRVIDNQRQAVQPPMYQSKSLDKS